MKDVEDIKYYKTGEILSKCNYLGGKRHGEYTHYFISGEISYKYSYLDGKLHGKCIYYNESGEITSKSYYINGKFVSEFGWISYNRNIKLELLGL